MTTPPWKFSLEPTRDKPTLHRQLKAERLISVDRHRVTIDDPEGLQLLAQFEPLSPPVSAGSGH